MTGPATTTDARPDPTPWLRVYHSAVVYGREEGRKEGRTEGYEAGYAAGYAARAAEDEAFAELVADHLHANGVRAEDRRKFVSQLIDSMRAQQARRTHYQRLDERRERDQIRGSDSSGPFSCPN